MMKHRLPFSNLIIKDGPEVIPPEAMPSDIEPLPYSVMTFESVWDTYGRPALTRNWKKIVPYTPPLYQTDPIYQEQFEYLANKSQDPEDNSFLKFVPMGNNQSKGIYMGLVMVEQSVNNNSVDGGFILENSWQNKYQIGIGDCDIKHRPWKNLEVVLEITTRTTYAFAIRTYEGFDESDPSEWEVIDESESDAVSNVTITLTEEMFPLTTEDFQNEQKLVMHRDPIPVLNPEGIIQEGGFYLSGPLWITGYGQSYFRTIYYSEGPEEEVSVGAAKTFWSLGGDAPGGSLSYEQFTGNDDETYYEYNAVRPFVSRIISVTPASAFEPPTP